MTPDSRHSTRQAQQERAIKFSIYGSGLLFIIIALAGIITDSVTLNLDAATNFVIFAVALLTQAMVRKVHQPPDHRYNFGYTKFEPFTVVIQAGLIVMLCIMSANFAFQDILHPDDIKNYLLPVAIEVVSGVIALAITLHLAHVGRKTDSAMLKGAALQWKMETVLSFGIAGGFLIGMFLRYKGFTHITPYVDPVMALMLAGILVYEPIKTLCHTVPELLDAAPAEHIQTTVRRIVDKYKPHAFGVSRLRTRKAGRKVFVDVCFLVKGDMTVIETAELADSFQRDMETHLPDSDVLVHFRHKR